MTRVKITKSVFGGLRVGYECPNCRERLRSPLTDAGKADTCPNCHAQFTVPGTTELRQETQRKTDEENRKQLEAQRRAQAIDLETQKTQQRRDAQAEALRRAEYEEGQQSDVERNQIAGEPPPLLTAQPALTNSKSATEQAGIVSLVLLFGTFFLCCGCPMMMVNSGSGGSSYDGMTDAERAEHGRQLLNGEASWFDDPRSDSSQTDSKWKRKNDEYHRTWGHSRDQYDYRGESTASDRAVEREYGLDSGDVTHLRKKLEELRNR